MGKEENIETYEEKKKDRNEGNEIGKKEDVKEK